MRLLRSFVISSVLNLQKVALCIVDLCVVLTQMPVDFKTYPVIVFLEGEMFTHSNPGRYPAEDLAAEGLVVVSVHYRLNIFGTRSDFARFFSGLTDEQR